MITVDDAVVSARWWFSGPLDDFVEEAFWRDELKNRDIWDRRVVVYGKVAYDEGGKALSITDVADVVDRQGIL